MEKRRLKKLEDELWRVIPDSDERYQVSNYGRVKSFAYKKDTGQILNGFILNGYKQVQINTKKIKRKYYIHKLVAQVWIPKPSDKHTFVTHLDGNLRNNHFSNLEWHTRETLTATHRITVKRSRVVRNSKLKESDISHLKSMLERGIVQATIAKLFCISEMQVTRIKRGENWGHVKPSMLNKNLK
jgi:hypothetical protein